MCQVLSGRIFKGRNSNIFCYVTLLFVFVTHFPLSSLSLAYVVDFTTLDMAVMRFQILDFSPLYYFSSDVSGHSFIMCLCFSAVRWQCWPSWAITCSYQIDLHEFTWSMLVKMDWVTLKKTPMRCYFQNSLRVLGSLLNKKNLLPKVGKKNSSTPM